MPSRWKPVRTWTSEAPRRTAWNVSSSVRTSRTGRPVSSAMNASERLVLGVLLAAERAARVGREDADLRERQPEHARDDPLQPVRVLDRAPDRDAVAVGRGHECVGLDGELGDHREVVGVLDDQVRLALGGVDVAPAVAVLAQDVRAGQRVVRAERRVLDERRIGGERRGDRVTRGQRLVVDPDQPRPPPRPRPSSPPRPPRRARRGTSSRRRR